MIQIYAPNNTNFSANGDEILLPSVAEVSAEINGTWSAKVVHPLDPEGRWKNIVENAVIKMHTWQAADQLFRVVKVTLEEDQITADCDPIFYDCIGELWLNDVRPTDLLGQEALDWMLSEAMAKNTAVKDKYFLDTDVAGKATAYHQNKNMLEALIGSENSFIKRWGGEANFDNYHFSAYKRIGDDFGVELRYGKNIPNDGIVETVDFSTVVTAILPTIYNGVKPTTNGERSIWYSPLADSYPNYHYKEIKFEDYRLAEDAEEGTDPNYIADDTEQLTTMLDDVVQQEFANGIDKPSVTIEVKMELLEGSEEYGEYAALERVHLGDTVHLKHSKLGIESTARVVAIKWDALEQMASEVSIGSVMVDTAIDALARTAQMVENVITEDGGIKATGLQGVIDMAKTALKYQRNVATAARDRAILFEDRNTSSQTYGALAIGSAGIEIAEAQTSEGEWIWKTAINAKGIYADYLIGQVIQGLILRCGGNEHKGRIEMLDKNDNIVGIWDRTAFALYSREGVQEAANEMILANGCLFFNTIDYDLIYGERDDGTPVYWRNHLAGYAPIRLAEGSGRTNIYNKNNDPVAGAFFGDSYSSLNFGYMTTDGGMASTNTMHHVMSIIGPNVTPAKGSRHYNVEFEGDVLVTGQLYMPFKYLDPILSVTDVSPLFPATSGLTKQNRVGGYAFYGNLCVIDMVVQVSNLKSPSADGTTYYANVNLKFPKPNVKTPHFLSVKTFYINGTTPTNVESSDVYMDRDGNATVTVHANSVHTMHNLQISASYVCAKYLQDDAPSVVLG